MAGRDVGTGALIEPKNMDKEASWSCRTDHAPDTVTHPMVGETENASHTEKLTSPGGSHCSAADRRPQARRLRRPAWRLRGLTSTISSARRPKMPSTLHCVLLFGKHRL